MGRGIVLWMLGLLIISMSHAHAYQLAYKDTPGTVRWYRAQFVFYGSVTPQPLNQTLHLSGSVAFTYIEKVLAVGHDGTASIQAQITEGSIFVNLPDLNHPPISVPIGTFTACYKRAPSGKVTELTVKGLPAPIAGMPGMNFSDGWRLFSHNSAGFEFPTGDIQAGASWTNDSSVEFMGQQIGYHLVNVFTGPRVINQVRYLQIDSKTTMKAPALTLQIPVKGKTVTIHEALDSTVNASILFDAAAGEMFNTWLDGDSDFSITAPEPGTNQPHTTSGTVHISGGMSKIAPRGLK